MKKNQQKVHQFKYDRIKYQKKYKRHRIFYHKKLKNNK